MARIYQCKEALTLLNVTVNKNIINSLRSLYLKYCRQEANRPPSSGNTFFSGNISTYKLLRELVLYTYRPVYTAFKPIKIKD